MAELKKIKMSHHLLFAIGSCSQRLLNDFPAIARLEKHPEMSQSSQSASVRKCYPSGSISAAHLNPRTMAH